MQSGEIHSETQKDQRFELKQSLGLREKPELES